MTDSQEEPQSKVPKEQPEKATLAEFLEAIPPNQQVNVKDLKLTITENYASRGIIKTPDLQLHCPESQCNGYRFFRYTQSSQTAPHIGDKSFSFFYLTYQCSNCQTTQKTFSLAAKAASEFDQDNFEGVCYKFGELPTFGPPTSSHLIKLIGPDRDTFLQGRRCENQGLGIGALVYYRRVVENQKNRILQQIIKVAAKLEAKPESIETLKAAVAETQYSKALTMVKDSIPESLLINGHNPMLLLHRALSDGIHDRSDNECLEVATSIRVVLAELSDRLSQALKDEEQLRHALSTLLNNDKA